MIEAMLTHGQKALFVRLDRIGDLCLSLSADEAIAPAEARWWIAEGLGFIASSAVPPRTFEELPLKIGIAQAWRLWRSLRHFCPEIAVVFHAPWWAGFLLWAARVPIRVGPRSQWHSFLFFNRGVRQRRSQSIAHEHEYNVRLLEAGLGAASGSLRRSPLRLRALLPERAQDLLFARSRLRPGDFFVAHPGMGGSALNWPTERWADLIRRLSHVAPVAITGTKADNAHLAPLRALLEGNPGARWLDGQLSSAELLALLSRARAVAAPSTGVAHLAAALGRRTVGIYSPVLAQAPTRWAPLGPEASALAPKVACPGVFSCLGEACPRWNCMNQIEANEVFAAMTR
jgi:ADP-heptose:LPS heptosyltransferase